MGVLPIGGVSKTVLVCKYISDQKIVLLIYCEKAQEIGEKVNWQSKDFENMQRLLVDETKIYYPEGVHDFIGSGAVESAKGRRNFSKIP